MVPKRLLDCCSAVLGLYLFASPTILGFGAEGGLATWVAWMLGLAIAVLAGLRLTCRRFGRRRLSTSSSAPICSLPRGHGVTPIELSPRRTLSWWGYS